MSRPEQGYVWSGKNRPIAHYRTNIAEVWLASDPGIDLGRLAMLVGYCCMYVLGEGGKQRHKTVSKWPYHRLRKVSQPICESIANHKCLRTTVWKPSLPPLLPPFKLRASRGGGGGDWDARQSRLGARVVKEVSGRHQLWGVEVIILSSSSLLWF